MISSSIVAAETAVVGGGSAAAAAATAAVAPSSDPPPLVVSSNDLNSGGGEPPPQQQLQRRRKRTRGTDTDEESWRPTPAAAAATTTTTPQRHNDDDNNNDHAKLPSPPPSTPQEQQQHLLLLNPHTLRLLKLVQEGTVEHAQLAATLLAEMTSSSSPMVLWDILGRLQGYLQSPEWKTRHNASLAMEGVARQLPRNDQQEFLTHGAVHHRDQQQQQQQQIESQGGLESSPTTTTTSMYNDTTNNDNHNNSNTWLTLDDVKEHLSTILEKGRPLLSTSESNYNNNHDNNQDNNNNDEHEEEALLEQLDATAAAAEKAEFIQRRVQLQRLILARRLGLSSVLSHVGGKHLEDSVLSIQNDDFVYDNNDNDDDGARRNPVVRKSAAAAAKSKDDDTKSIRALLVMELRQQQQQQQQLQPGTSFRQVSHKNAQCLLATELVYRMFDASWYVRHGSLMGIMALMRAWKVHEASHFGIWPLDIMSRCLCILGLDRFADYSETATSSETGGIVAPVREMAGQVFAILFWAAPESIQRSSYDSIVHLSIVHRDDEDDASSSWEIRHAALLALKYVMALRGGVLNKKNDVPATDWTIHELSDHVLELATRSLNDTNHDTRGMAAQLLVVWLNTEWNPHHHSRSLISHILNQLWGALSPSILISSTVKDIVTLLDVLIRNDFRQVIAGIPTCEGRAPTTPCSRLLSRLALLTTAPYLSVKCVVVVLIGKAAKELELFLQDDTTTTDVGKEARAEITHSFCDVVWVIYRLRFDSSIQLDPEMSQEEIRFFAACDETWLALARSSRILLGESMEARFTLEQKILSTFFGFPMSGLRATPHIDSAISLTEASFGKHHRFLVDAADAVAVFLSESGSSRPTQSQDMLHLFLRLSLDSPLMSHFERGCLLYTSLSPFPHTPMLNASRECFISAIHGKIKCCMMDPHRIRDVAVKLQKMLGKYLENGLESLVKGSCRSIEEITNEVTTIWGQFTDQFYSASGTLSPTLDSMRLTVLITGAIVSGGRDDLPEKLTPLVRGVMTSVQNENDPECQNTALRVMTTLLRLLFEDASVSDSQNLAFVKTRGKILQNLCTIIKARVEPGSINASKIIGRVAGSVTQPVESLGETWNEVAQLQDSHETNGTIGAVLILAAMCHDLTNRRTGEFFIHSFARSLVSLSCTAMDDSIKCYSSECLQKMRDFDQRLLLEESLPKIALMCTNESDAIRSQACEVLFEMIDTTVAALCPYVRSLLPLAMRLMTDSSKRVAQAGARVFSTLVQLAPLVKESATLQLLSESGTETTDQVIDHLIHGQPLPPCEIHPTVRQALEASGVHLRTYQLDGITWLRFLQQVGLNGALTDSMGLGKTLQALVGISLAHTDVVKSSHQAPMSLVVCPSSVLGHWEKEVSRFFPGGTVFRHYCLHGPNRKNPIPNDCNLVITSYASLRSEIALLNKRKWTYIVLDEGHLLKNPETATAKAARRLNSRFKLILTGTPVQNKVNEVWACFDFLMPNFLGSSVEFSREFAKPISKGQRVGAGASDIALSMEKLKLLHQQVLPFILRREKENVLKELPPKVITTIQCEMSPQQGQLYHNFCQSSQGRRFLGSFHRALQEPSTDSTIPNLGHDVLKAMLYLRLVCTHPALVEVSGSPSKDGSQIGMSGKLVALKGLLVECGLPSQDLVAADNDTSLLYVSADESDEQGIDDFEEVLDPRDNGPSYFNDLSSSRCKCLIFAQFTSSLDIVEALLHHHFPAVSYLRLDGKVPVPKRGEIVDSFNESDHIKILLLTTRIGGLGLNLTGRWLPVALSLSFDVFGAHIVVRCFHIRCRYSHISRTRLESTRGFASYGSSPSNRTRKDRERV